MLNKSFKSPESSDVLINGVSKTVKHETRRQEGKLLGFY